MKIVIAGPKSVGKSTIGRILQESTGLKLIETDELIEAHFEEETGQRQTCRELYQQFGEDRFRDMEKHVAGHLQEADWSLIISGGSSLVDPDCRRALRNNAILIYLKGDAEEIWQRLEKNGLPPWRRMDSSRAMIIGSFGTSNGSLSIITQLSDSPGIFTPSQKLATASSTESDCF